MLLTDECACNEDTAMEWLIFIILLVISPNTLKLYCTRNVDSTGCTVLAEGSNSNIESCWHKAFSFIHTVAITI